VTRPPVIRLTEQLGHLINLSRIIDRNKDDGQYEDLGNEIIYVFDTNVVQMFWEPYQNPQFCEVFHKEYWGEDRIQDREINSQACLLTAEYLMSGDLPGQRGGRWFMTRGHKAELDAQEQFLTQQVKDNLKRMREEPPFKEAVLAGLKKLSAALAIDPSGDRQTLEALALKLSPRTTNLRELRALPEKQFRQRIAGVRAGEVSRLLAQDQVAEPANQLYRYRHGKIAGRFMALEEFLGLSAADRREVDKEVEDWRLLLGRILNRRPNHMKTRDAFKADCEALGLVSWANRRPEHRNRRILLVTGDAVILEAYRGRHLEDPHHNRYNARPINHYAPLFNPISAHSVLPVQQHAFRRLQEVLEVVLVDLNIQLLLSADTRLRARDAFVLEIEQNIDRAVAHIQQAFPQMDDQQWLNSQQAALETLVQQLRPIERLMLEAFPNLVARRLEEERISFEDASKEGGDALATAIEARLAAASQIGAQFSLQTMPATLERLFEALRDNSEERERRATVYVRLTFGDGPESGYEVTIQQLRGLSPEAMRAAFEGWKDRPAKIFALAAMIAFNLEFWSEAARYAELAATASHELATYTPEAQHSQEEHCEYLYLMAASFRFRMAAFETGSDISMSDPRDQWLTTAERALKSCIDFHVQHGQLSRAMRARSELAAVHLAFCEWVAFGPTTNGPASGHKALASLLVAVRQLALCESGLTAALAHADEVDHGRKGLSNQLLERVRRQFRTNVSAAKLAALRLAEQHTELAEDIKEAVALAPPANLTDNWPDAPAIAAVYRAAAEGRYAEVLTYRDAPFSLALDRVVMQGLVSMVEAGLGRD